MHQQEVQRPDQLLHQDGEQRPIKTRHKYDEARMRQKPIFRVGLQTQQLSFSPHLQAGRR